ncbi:hypothetical protein PR202_ga29720 [Eleusine coracana subsp. coracana]|uniref:Gnk2-homologous domain-containing protein n=1 Tax=Eleusine coracana subsp. coracana TaxID=191504 RepID=A0AAV5DM53_ELECO|nr:hypothetical protein PR202_ga29720 [Eleusine coracana subsp. coracana]
MATHHRRHHHRPSYLAVSLLLPFLLVTLTAGDPFGQSCDTNFNYTANSSYQANMKNLSTTLPKTISSSQKLFATSMIGAVPDVVYALALCRGDTNASTCESCVATAFQDAQELCAFNRGATLFYDPCLLRYSYRNFLAFINGGGDEFIILKPMRNVSTSGNKYQATVAVLDNSNEVLILLNTQNVSAPSKVFDAAVGVLVNATADYAAKADNPRKFGSGVAGFQTFDGQNPRIYGLAQCTPDMAPADCRTCLADVIQAGSKYFSGSQGGRIIGVRCNYRYELYNFLAGSPLLQLPEPDVRAPAPATGGGEFLGHSLQFKNLT